MTPPDFRGNTPPDIRDLRNQIKLLKDHNDQTARLPAVKPTRRRPPRKRAPQQRRALPAPMPPPRQERELRAHERRALGTRTGRVAIATHGELSSDAYIAARNRRNMLVKIMQNQC